MTRDIIAAIDHAVQDWETGPDAMRWAPERPAEPERPQRFHPGGVVRPTAPAPTPEDVRRAMERLGEAMRPLPAAFRRIAEAASAAGATLRSDFERRA